MNIQVSTLSASKELFIQFTQVLEEAGAPYCILAGYDEYPEAIASDVDFMVPPGWIDRLPALMAVAAARSRAHLIQCIRHETTAAYFVIARLDGSSVSYLHPDASSDYRRHGRRWLDAEAVLENRRRHARGFWVPAPADAFAYYLIKKIDKGERLQAEQAGQLTRRYLEDAAGGSRVLRELFPAGLALQLESAAKSGAWSSMPSLALLGDAMQRRGPREPLGSRIKQVKADCRRLLDRIAQPTGLHIVFLGPDGSGKSSLISRVSSEMSRAFRHVHYQHLRPGVLSRPADSGAVTDPHAKPARGPVGSMLKLVYFWLDFAVAEYLWLRPRKIRSTLLVFDRYYHDILADPLRYRYDAPLGLARWLGRGVPQPDLVFILDAPSDVLRRRKQEIPEAEGLRQRGAYLALKAEFRQSRVIDVSQPLEQVVAEVLRHIIAAQAVRTTRRLRVNDRIEPAALADPVP
jgi:thymidylate kinase